MNLNIVNSVLEKSELFSQQVQLFKALTHPARIAILEILRDGEHCVCHMEAHLGFRQAYISQQLSVLREAGLIQDRRDGWNIYYRVTDLRIFTVLDQVYQMTGQELVRSNPPSEACTCPHCKK